MAKLDARKLMGEIRKNNIGGAYFLYGSELYLLNRCLERLLQKAVPSPNEFNPERFEGEKGALDLSALEDAVDNLPFMASSKTVVVHDLNPEQLAAEDTKRLQKLVENLPENVILVFYVTGFEVNLKTSRKTQNFIKFMEKAGTVGEFSPLSKPDLAKFLMDQAAKRQCFLSAAAADRMIDRSGSDLTNLLSELDQLIAFTGEGEITVASVDTLVPQTMDATAFDLANTLLRGNLSGALGIVGELKAQRAEPIMVAGALNSAFVDLYRAKCALAAGANAAQVTADFGYNPRVRFRVDNAFRSAGRMELSRLRQGIRCLHALDLTLKSSRADAFECLEQTLVKIHSGIE